ncbi:MAG: hypothetical protein IBX68_11495 [Dehalococcoidia bacterium]|nr:hypothetical protein [Dehalococcoidia bacterium]
MKLRHSLVILLALFFVLQPLLPASAQNVMLDLEVVRYPHLVFDGDRVEVLVSISNVSSSQVYDISLVSSTGEQKVVGSLAPGVSRETTFVLTTYEPGLNRVELHATHTGGESPRKSIWFEVRPPEESVTLRIVQAPQSIYEGSIFNAVIEVQNLWQEAVDGTRIRSAGEVLYYVGALNPNQSLSIDLRLDQCETGVNRLDLVAEHERGKSRAVPLEFEVIPADSAVRVFLSSLTPASYATETLRLSLVVAAAEQAGVSELEIRSLTPGLQPDGYYVGEQIAETQEVYVVDLSSLLTGGTTEQEQISRSVRGKELTFEIKDPAVGQAEIEFKVSYRLGRARVEKDFAVNASIIDTPGMRLIQADPVTASRGKDSLVVLHVANDLPVQVEAVRVVPVGTFQAYPSEFFIGTMSPNDFLPASFRINGGSVLDGERPGFKLIYRIGRNTYETEPVSMLVNYEKTGGISPLVYILPPALVVLSVPVWWSLRRKWWTR